MCQVQDRSKQTPWPLSSRAIASSSSACRPNAVGSRRAFPSIKRRRSNRCRPPSSPAPESRKDRSAQAGKPRPTASRSLPVQDLGFASQSPDHPGVSIHPGATRGVLGQACPLFRADLGEELVESLEVFAEQRKGGPGAGAQVIEAGAVQIDGVGMTKEVPETEQALQESTRLCTQDGWPNLVDGKRHGGQ